MNKQAVITIDNQPPTVLTPMELLSRATANGASIEVLEKLMTLQERYEKNEARKAFDEAISAAKAEIDPITKNRDGHNTKYADIAAIAIAVVPAMSRNGLSHRYRISQTDRISVTCIIAHKLGHYEETTLSGAPDKTGSKNDIQAIGSTVTYLERYTLVAALGLSVSNDDIDGNRVVINGKVENETVEDPHISETQIAFLRKTLTDAGRTEEAFLKYIKCPSLENIYAHKFDHACQVARAKKGVAG